MSRNSPNRNIFQKLIKLNETNEVELFYESDLKLFNCWHSYILLSILVILYLYLLSVILEL